MTRIVPVDQHRPDGAVIEEAAQVLGRGGLVAFPTETVYGLGAIGTDANAVRRIYEAKGRPAWNPVIQHVASVEAARQLVATWPMHAEQLARAFWPGPLTLVLPKSGLVPDIATAGATSVGIRIPAHPVALALIDRAGKPLAAPSANRFTQVSPTTAQHVFASLVDRVDVILDGGPCEVGIESTVLDLTGSVPTVLRPGMISRQQLQDVLGVNVAIASRRIGLDNPVATVPTSPGLASKHYAPRGDVWLVAPGDIPDTAAALGELRSRGGRAAALVVNGAFAQSLALPSGSLVFQLPGEPAGYARTLYAMLRRADEHGAEVIVIEQPPEGEAWDAIRDRLTRAAAVP